MISLDEETVLVIHRHFKAPPARVFAAWSSREGWQAWIGPRGIDCAVHELDCRPGGSYRLTMTTPEGRIMPVAGTFRTVTPDETLVFTWGWDGDPAKQSLITLTFHAKEGGTEMVLRQEGLPSRDQRDGHRGGWESAFDKLREYVE